MTDSAPAALGYTLLVVQDGGCRPFVLALGRPERIGWGPGCAPRLEGDAAPGEGVLELSWEDGSPTVREQGSLATRLNDVQLSGPTRLRPGDVLGVGGAQLLLLVQSGPAPAPPRRLLSADELEEQLLRATSSGAPERRPFSLLALGAQALAAVGPGSPVEALLRQLPDALPARLGPEQLVLLFPDCDATGREAHAAAARGLMAGLGLALTSVQGVTFPQDGGESEALLERLFFPPALPEEPTLHSPYMLRVRGLLERFARSAASGPFTLHLEGECGVGKVELGRHFHALAAPTQRLWVLDCAQAAVAGAEAALEKQLLSAQRGLGSAEGTVLLRRVELLPDRLQALFARGLGASGVRVVTTSRSPLAVLAGARHLRPELAELLGRRVLPLPPLRDRSEEVLPLAERALEELRRVLRRPALALSRELKDVLVRQVWPGNVRGLRVALARVAAEATGSELGVSLLPARLRGLPDGVPEGLRGRLRATEREVLLETLARTRWNVTLAARELGLPRRTVVYRMSRLGLRRPS